MAISLRSSSVILGDDTLHGGRKTLCEGEDILQNDISLWCYMFLCSITTIASLVTERFATTLYIPCSRNFRNQYGSEPRLFLNPNHPRPA